MLFQVQSIQGQVFKPGDFFVGGYVGGPNLFPYQLKNLAMRQGINDMSASGTLPIGLRIGFLFAKKHSTEIEISYVRTKAEWSNTNANGTVYTKTNMPTIRYSSGYWNYHFFSSEKVGLYAGWGAGYGITLVIPSEGEYGQVESQEREDFIELIRGTRNFLVTNEDAPVFFRAQAGAYILLSRRFLLNLEASTGAGGAIKAGLYYKFKFDFFRK